MKLLSAGACGDVDHGAGVPAVFGAVGRIIDLELGNRVDRGLERDLVLRHVIEVDPINHEIGRSLASAGGIKRKCSLAAQRGGESAIGGIGYGSWNQQR